MSDHELLPASDGLMLKRYRINGHNAARREWRALNMLHRYDPGLVPEPVSADFSSSRPWITMSVLPGEALGNRPLSSLELRAMGDALDRLHTCVPDEELISVSETPVAPRRAVAGIARLLAAQPRPDDDAVVGLAYDEALRWLAGPDAGLLASEEPDKPTLARGDHNLTNFLWDGDRVRLVDFEYAGRCDRAADIADLVEHISARVSPDHTWRQFLDELDLSRTERRRVRLARRLYSMSWLRLLLPGQDGEHRNPPGTLRAQAERTLYLLNT